jgi:hypothetical protein
MNADSFAVQQKLHAAIYQSLPEFSNEEEELFIIYAPNLRIAFSRCNAGQGARVGVDANTTFFL